jgi:hypothetical protein
MKRLTKFALRHVPSLVICLLSLCALSLTQEVDVPSGRGSGSVVAPTPVVISQNLGRKLSEP